MVPIFRRVTAPADNDREKRGGRGEGPRSLIGRGQPQKGDGKPSAYMTSRYRRIGEVSGTFYVRECCDRMPSWAESGEWMRAA